MLLEQWQFIPNVPHTYMVSNRGRVFSVRAQRVIGAHDRGDVTIYIDKKPVICKPANLVKAAFGLACGGFNACEDASMCWRCGLNPEVGAERLRHLRERGLTKAPNGIKYFKILPEDLKGYQDINFKEVETK